MAPKKPRAKPAGKDGEYISDRVMRGVFTVQAAMLIGLAISGSIAAAALFTVAAIGAYYNHRKVVKYEEELHQEVQQIRGGVLL